MKRATFALADQLDALTERYLNSEIHDAAAALQEAETFMRGPGSRLRSSKFGLALILAKRSDIVMALGDSSHASQLLDEAVALFRETSLGLRAGLSSPQAVLQFIREQDATSRVRWRSKEMDSCRFDVRQK